MGNRPHWQQSPASPAAIDIADRFAIAHKWLVKLIDGEGAGQQDSHIAELHRIGKGLARDVFQTEGALAHVHNNGAFGASVWLQWIAHHSPVLPVPADMPGLREMRPKAEITELMLA